MRYDRQNLLDLVAEQRTSLASLSRRLGRNAAYLQQYVHRGSPKRLADVDRLNLAIILNVDERRLGARDPWTPIDVASSTDPAA